jgi:hypothetical protein
MFCIDNRKSGIIQLIRLLQNIMDKIQKDKHHNYKIQLYLSLQQTLYIQD